MNVSNTPYADLKTYYDTVLNKDKKTFKTSNDEPTPIGCVELMLSKIPETAFKKKNLKILDPCCGNGNFHLVMWNNLLTRKYENDKILREILHFNDTNTERLKNVRNYFGEQCITYNVDFLQSNFNKKFDIIYANPPYAKLMDNGKRASKNHNLISLFINKSLEYLEDGGYLIFIIPDNWMSLSDRNTLIRKLTSYQFHWLDIHTAKKWFPKVGSSFTWFVLEKTPAYKSFHVNVQYNREIYCDLVESEERSYIPLLYNKTVQSILHKTLDSCNPKYNVETSSDLHKYTKKSLISTVENDEFKYRLIHTPKQTVYANRPHKYQDGYKVFISTTDKYKVFIDNCGMTQSIAFIRCTDYEDAVQIQKTLQHKMYIFLNDICRWGNFNNIRILQRFPKPDISGTCVYNYYNLNNEEIEFIERIVS
jgi:adenine-specific DNA-methyltransferase